MRFDLVVVLFTFWATLNLALGFVLMLLGLSYLLIARRRESAGRLWKYFLYIYGGFAAGTALAWFLVILPSGWNLPIWETAYAGFHSDIYGHAVEHAAEQYFLFLLFVGDCCAVAAGTIARIRGRNRPRTLETMNMKNA